MTQHDETATYSGRRFGLAAIGSVVAVAALISLILSSQIAMAVMPIIGVGELFVEIDRFEGNQAKVYPQLGQTVSDPSDPNSPPTIGLTDSSGCQLRPLMVFQLDSATVDGYNFTKDVKLPFRQGWMTIKLEQPNGELTGDKLKMYVSSMRADELKMFNVQVAEGQGGTPPGESSDPYRKWGPYSDEFLLQSDLSKNRNPDMIATGVQLWSPAFTASNVNFVANQTFPIDIQLVYNSTPELHTRYRNKGFVDPGGVDRESYFSCKPTHGPPTQDKSDLSGEYTWQSWESGDSGNWGLKGDAQIVESKAAYNVSFSDDPTPGQNFTLKIGDDNSTATSPVFDLSGENQERGLLPVGFVINETTFDNVPEDEDTLAVEYKHPDGTWKPFRRFAGGDAPDRKWDATYLPKKAYHSDFQMRFRTNSTPGGPYDYWWVDHIFIG